MHDKKQLLETQLKLNYASLKINEQYGIEEKTKPHAFNAAACINDYVPVSFDELVENNRRFQVSDHLELI